MKQWKKLAALLLAGVVALTVLTGCDGKTGAVVNGENIVKAYLAYGEKWDLYDWGTGEYDADMDKVAAKSLDIIAGEVAAQGSITWENAVGDSGYLISDEGFAETEAGKELGIVMFGKPEPYRPSKYKFIFVLSKIPETMKDSPAMIAYKLRDLTGASSRAEYHTKPEVPSNDGFKFGAAVKTVGDETYALLTGLYIID